MKKLLLAAAAVSALSATPAMAADNKADITVSGTINVACTVTPDESAVTVNLDSTDAQSLGGLTYRCNAANGFTRTIASDNKSRLINGGDASKGFVPYTVSGTGGSGIAITTPRSLATDLITNLSSSSAFVNGQTGQLRVILAKPASSTDDNPLYAGTYTDVIRVSITAN